MTEKSRKKRRGIFFGEKGGKFKKVIYHVVKREMQQSIKYLFNFLKLGCGVHLFANHVGFIHHVSQPSSLLPMGGEDGSNVGVMEKVEFG